MSINLSFSGVKGRSGNHDLGPVNVVVGDNGAGKSSILTALRLALLGYDPALGKTAAATWQLSSGQEMRVKLGMPPNGIRRSWTLERGSVKNTADQVGNWNIPAPLVDVRAFLRLPAKARAEYIMGLVPVPETTVQDALAAIADAAPGRVEVWLDDRDAHTTPGEWLVQVLEQVQTQGKDAAAAAKEAEATVRRLVDTQAGTDLRGVTDQSDASAAADADVARLVGIEAAGQKVAQYAQAARGAALDLKTAEDSLVAARTRLASLDDVPREAYDAARAGLVELGPSLHNEMVTHDAASGQRRKLGTTGKCPLCGCAADELGDKLDSEIAGAKERMGALSVEIASCQAIVDNWCAAEGLKCELAVMVGRVEDARRRVAELPHNGTEIESVADKLTAARAHVTSLRTAQRQWETAQARRAMQAKAEQDAMVARAAAEMWSAAATALKKVREAAVASSFAGFAAQISQFTDNILGFDLLVRDGEIGYMADGIWVSHEVFSGSEMALVYAGLGVALAGTATLKLVIVDEVLLDDDTKRKIAHRMLDLTSQGIIDAAVFVDVTDAGWPTLCEFLHVEPFPEGEIIIGRGAIIDAVRITKNPRIRK